MAQLIDDCFAFGGRLLPVAEALAILRRRITPICAAEEVPLTGALGRILAADLVATAPIPPYDNAAVDGYGVAFADLDPTAETTLPLAGRAAAGHPFAGTPGRGTAIRIFTGAPLPPGINTVAMQEDCKTSKAGGTGEVTIPPGLERFSNCRPAGEDVAAGTVALTAGRQLRPQDLAMAAALGHTTLPVRRALRVAVFSTGDEVHDPGTPLPASGIYDSNRYGLMALLQQMGCAVSDLGILADDPVLIEAALKAAAPDHDLLITSGGMSTGDEDHIKAVVEKLGALHFWRLSIKPGRPVALGQIADTAFVGLPGNPVAMMVTFLRFARPVILRLAGATETEPALFRVTAGFSYRKKPGRREWVRAMLRRGPDGSLRVEKFPRAGSGILSSLVAAHGLVELPEEMTSLDPGAEVDFLPFSHPLLTPDEAGDA